MGSIPAAHTIVATIWHRPVTGGHGYGLVTLPVNWIHTDVDFKSGLATLETYKL